MITKILKKCIICIIVVSMVLLTTACENSTSNQTTNKPSYSGSVSQDSKFGSANVSVKPDEFNSKGFALGDSVDIKFSNGYSLDDVPYFNGYYVNTGAPVMVAYPGNDYLIITYNYKGIWSTAKLSDKNTVAITLNTKGKYLTTQEALGQSYSFEKTDSQSVEEFSNFRALSGGKLMANFLFRGTSPVDNSKGRASYVSALLEQKGIKFIMDLSDSENNMQEYMTKGIVSAYVKSLYDSGNLVLLAMGSSYESQKYHESVAQGLRAMTKSEGPVYIHCMEGKDRTGFVCMLMEALAGASYDEMLADYMTTYKNYFGITKVNTPEKYEAVVKLYFNAYMEYLHGSSDVNVLKTANFSDDARKYLIEGGMSDQEINDLYTMICN